MMDKYIKLQNYLFVNTFSRNVASSMIGEEEEENNKNKHKNIYWPVNETIA